MKVDVSKFSRRLQAEIERKKAAQTPVEMAITGFERKYPYCRVLPGSNGSDSSPPSRRTGKLRTDLPNSQNPGPQTPQDQRTATRPTASTSETALVKACLAWLDAKGIFAWQNNSGALPVGDRFIRFGKVGSSDILGILPGGRMLAIECKARGGKVTDAQCQFLTRIRDNKGLALLVYDIDPMIGAVHAALAGGSKT